MQQLNTHTNTHIQSAITQVSAQGGSSDATTHNHGESSKSWVEKLTPQAHLPAQSMQSESVAHVNATLYMYVCRFWWNLTFISIYFCCKGSPVTAVLWGYIRVMHLFRCKRTGVERTCVCFINASCLTDVGALKVKGAGEHKANMWTSSHVVEDDCVEDLHFLHSCH